jgi:hypothetical protein
MGFTPDGGIYRSLQGQNLKSAEIQNKYFFTRNILGEKSYGTHHKVVLESRRLFALTLFPLYTLSQPPIEMSSNLILDAVASSDDGSDSEEVSDSGGGIRSTRKRYRSRSDSEKEETAEEEGASQEAGEESEGGGSDEEPGRAGGGTDRDEVPRPEDPTWRL